MNEQKIKIEKLTPAAFAPFGDVIDADRAVDFTINRGMCERFHDLARVQFEGGDARAGISIFTSRPIGLPFALDLMERHPLGSQAFLPLSDTPYLAIVAADEDGKPQLPRAFLVGSTQGINILANTWHGVLAPLNGDAVFAVIDRIGSGNNLEEYELRVPYMISDERGRS